MSKGMVLVVDDEESIRFSFMRFLSDAGFDVEVASSVEDARTMLLEREFNVAIIDNTFPSGQSGMDLLAFLHDIQPSCQAILVSGYPDIKSSEENENLKFYTHLCKPVKKVELCSAVEDAVAQARKGRRE